MKPKELRTRAFCQVIAFHDGPGTWLQEMEKLARLVQTGPSPSGVGGKDTLKVAVENADKASGLYDVAVLIQQAPLEAVAHYWDLADEFCQKQGLGKQGSSKAIEEFLPFLRQEVAAKEQLQKSFPQRPKVWSNAQNKVWNRFTSNEGELMKSLTDAQKTELEWVVKLEGSDVAKAHRANLVNFLENRLSIRGAMQMTGGTGRITLGPKEEDGSQSVLDMNVVAGFQAAGFQTAPPTSSPPALQTTVEATVEGSDSEPEETTEEPKERASLGEDFEQYRVRKDLDIWVIPDFATEVLKFDPVAFQRDMEAKYPTVKAGEEIAPGEVQWVAGENDALYYRGNPVPRTKLWLQSGRPQEVGFRKYLYTGWQRTVLPATADVEKCPEVAAVKKAWDEFATARGRPISNHCIATSYPTGQHHVGTHFDKKKSIAPGSLIGVLKTGESARPFHVGDRVFLPRLAEESSRDYRERVQDAQDKVPPFFADPLKPGTAVIMTLEANLRTVHGVPISDAGASGSLVLRTLLEDSTIPYEKALQDATKSHEAKAEKRKANNSGKSTGANSMKKARRGAGVESQVIQALETRIAALEEALGGEEGLLRRAGLQNGCTLDQFFR